MQYKLRLEEHESYGDIGIKVVGTPDWMEPCTTGLVLAHDILEHPIKRHSSCYIDELHALGALYIWRYGYIGVKANEYRYLELRDIAAEVVFMLDGLRELYIPGKRVRLSEEFEDLVNKIREDVRNEEESLWSEEEEEYKLTGEELTDFARQMTSYIQKGAYLFRKRFSKICWNQLYYDVFNKIEEQANYFLIDGLEGDEAVLKVVFSKCQVELERVELEEDYY